MTHSDPRDPAEPAFDSPTAVAAEVLALPRLLLLGLDIDGVLAPIVAHADHARLLDGTADVLTRIAACATARVAVISGRSLDDLDRFGFPDGVERIGSHGMERAANRISLDTTESDRYEDLRSLAEIAARQAGSGAWVELKPASVVLHVREADPGLAADSVDGLAEAAGRVEGASAMSGSGVLELFVRHGDKGSAVEQLRTEHAAGTAVFVGDDVTDERGFAALGPGDVGIKVGDAPTVADRRLPDPHAVGEFLAALATGLERDG